MKQPHKPAEHEPFDGAFDPWTERDVLRAKTGVDTVEVLIGGPNTKFAGMFMIQYRRGIVFDPADGKKGIIRELVRPIKTYNRDQIAEIIRKDKEAYEVFQTQESLK